MAGYDWSAGKSNNAVAAESEGLRVRSKITRDWLQAAGITESVRFVKWLIAANIVTADEWHHSSKMFNRVNYFDAQGISEQLQDLTLGGRLDILRDMHAEGLRGTPFAVRDEMIHRLNRGK